MVQREKIFNFSGLDTENIDFRRSREVRGEKILSFRGPETENIDFWRSGEVRGGGPGGVFRHARISGPLRKVCTVGKEVRRYLWVSQ